MEINAWNVDNYINLMRKEIDVLLLILIAFNLHNFNVFLAAKDTMPHKMYANYFLLIAYNQTKKVNVWIVYQISSFNLTNVTQ